jgi:hypothetical protein
MINKYNQFILEKLINESVVQFSTKFRSLISDIDSPVAKTLKDIENKDLTVSSNYIDITDDKDMIGFIPDRKAQEMIKNTEVFVIYKGDLGILSHNLQQNGNIFKELGYVPSGEKAYKPNYGEKGLVVSKMTTTTTNRTYLYLKFPEGECVCNESKVEYGESSDLWTKFRQTIKVGRGIKALLTAGGQTFSDREIEEFVNKYKSAFDKMNDIYKDFELVDGEKIAFWYNKENYDRISGQLGNSCMSDVSPSYFDLYVENPRVCKLLILKTPSGDKIKGRALVWTLDGSSKIEDKIIFMDRVYTINDSDIDLFRDYAKSKKWYVKYNNNSTYSSESISPSGEKVNLGVIYVNLEKGDYDKYPYLDTLKRLEDTGKLTNDEDADGKVLEDTSGGYEGSECECCGGSGEIECGDCYGRGEVDCHTCDGDGDMECGTCDGDGEVDCGTCDGDGEVDCSTCEGNGEVDCDDCVDGIDSDGNKCETCDGSGKLGCNDCNSKGKIPCVDCSGTGHNECGDCYGRGKNDCDDCSGTGNTECCECYGRGQVDCYECNN